MSWTKRQFVTQAFEEVGLAAYVFDLTNDQLQSALRRLDAMIAMWIAKGINIGFPLATSPDNSDIDAETGVPLQANQAIILNLGIQIAPSYGKTVAMETKAAAKIALDVLLSAATFPNEQQFPSTLAVGAGWKRDTVYGPFASQPNEDPLTLDGSGGLVFNNK